MLDWLQRIIVSNGIVIIGAAIFDVCKFWRIFLSEKCLSLLPLSLSLIYLQGLVRIAEIHSRQCAFIADVEV